MLQVVSQLPKLQCLSIKTSSSRECLDVLDQQLQMTAFGELRKCHLQPALLRDDHVHLQLDHLLRASKLTSLRLCGISLAGFEKSSVTSHSTVLKDLTMTTCAVDRHSLSAFLSKPRALKSVHFGGLGPVGESTKHLNPRDELRTTELMHEILGREQPNIQKLRVSLRNGGVISFKQHRDGLIFKQLTNLKSLSFGTIGGALLWPTNDYDNGLWCPTNAFNGLPPAIECIKFRPPCGKIDLEGMALALNLDGLALTPNGWRYPRKDVPASLQQLEIFAEKRREWGTPRRELLPQRPFTEADQTTEDSLMNGIDRLMTGLTLKQLTCIERHEVWDLEGEKVDEEGEEKENSHSVCVIHYSFRKITATRNNAIAKSDQVSSCSSPYSVGEVTWEEFQTMYDYEYWQTLESEAY
ncbi:hypothetical protein H2200_007206 [Cladophialophora chaetospira]|uniref:Uncharacterized protein n=1 Tax=Cladophialophora chaetospira TaxID=386627 RepID=A0AA39CHF6_9EURO|nr:hypothetical protein H2200_007206 [Cladophialophora chaetospira]